MQRAELIACLRGELATAGVQCNEILFVHSNLAAIGCIEGVGSREELCAAYWQAITQQVGLRTGTILVPTFTRRLPGRADACFDVRATPGDTGMFSEYVRTMPGASRSLHPLYSCAAIGRQASELTGNASIAAFGTESPFDRAYRAGCRLLFLGVHLQAAMTFILYFYHLLGVSHFYHKAFFVPVIDENGCRRTGVHYSLVRNRDAGEWYLQPLEDELLRRRLLYSVPLGRSVLQVVDVHDAWQVAYEMLTRNPCCLMTKEYYNTV